MHPSLGDAPRGHGRAPVLRRARVVIISILCTPAHLQPMTNTAAALMRSRCVHAHGWASCSRSTHRRTSAHWAWTSGLSLSPPSLTSEVANLHERVLLSQSLLPKDRERYSKGMMCTVRLGARGLFDRHRSSQVVPHAPFLFLYYYSYSIYLYILILLHLYSTFVTSRPWLVGDERSKPVALQSPCSAWAERNDVHVGQQLFMGLAPLRLDSSSRFKSLDSEICNQQARPSKRP